MAFKEKSRSIKGEWAIKNALDITKFNTEVNNFADDKVLTTFSKKEKTSSEVKYAYTYTGTDEVRHGTITVTVKDA